MKKLFISVVIVLWIIVGGCRGENKKKKVDRLYGVITASRVNVRTSPNIKGRVLFQVNTGDTVEIMEEIQPDTTDKLKDIGEDAKFIYREYILVKKWKLYIPELDTVVSLPPGKALKLGYIYYSTEESLPEGGEKKCVEFNYQGKEYLICEDGERLNPPVEMITHPWYRIKSRDGKEGYVYAKFLKEILKTDKED